jgi:hypothetical protein
MHISGNKVQEEKVLLNLFQIGEADFFIVNTLSEWLSKSIYLICGFSMTVIFKVWLTSLTSMSLKNCVL